MPNPASPNRPEKYNIATFFSDVRGIELGFEQTKRSEWCLPLDHYYTLQAYLLNYPNTYLDGRDIHDVQQKGISN
jgi:DNA-cytosine methyltransferase family protein